MRKILIWILFAGILTSNAQSVSVAIGSSSADININSIEIGKIYYILRKTTMPLGNGQQIKDSSLTGNATKNVKRGKVLVNAPEVNQSIIQSLTDLQPNTPYYLYTCFESANGSISNPKEFQIKTAERLQKVSYNSKIPALNNQVLEYLIYKNESYLKDNSKKYPVLFFFHGDGEKKTSKNTIDLLKVSGGITKLISNGRDVDFLVVSVQMPVAITWITPGWLNELVEKVKSENRIDIDKIYVSGYSGGGGGMYYLTATQPEKIAAFVPVAAVNSFWNDKTMSYCNLKNIPMWGFHGETDNTVTYNNLKEPIKQIGLCSPAAITAPVITAYKDNTGGHGTIPYTAYNTEALYEWLVGKSKLSPSNIAPVITVNPAISVATGTSAIIEAIATDANGIASYEWIKKSGPDATTQSKYTSKLVLKNLLAGKYTFRVLVTDALKATSFKDVILTVSGGTVANSAPIVSAGVDKEITLPVTSLTINGTASDPDGTISSSKWSQIEGPGLAVMTNPLTKSLGLSGLLPGKYTFRYTATDNAGSQKSDDMIINVKALSTPVSNTSSAEIPKSIYDVLFAEGATVNKWKSKTTSEFYASAIKIQVDAADSKKVQSVEYTLNGITTKDEWADKDVVSGKYNYFYTYYALPAGNYTVQISVNETSGSKTKSEISFTIAGSTQARQGDISEINSNLEYQVYSLQGVILKEGRGELDKNSLATGIYLVKTQEGTSRILVE